MRELRFDGLSPDGTRLILAGNDGQKWSVVIDERIEAAVRRDRARIGQVEIEQAGMLRPREIQARIRSGQTAEDVAAASGLPIEHIRRFEGPVLTERAWVAQQAQATEVRRPGGDIELGDLVSERLHAEGVDAADIAWDAWRRDDGTWVVIATFPLPPNTHVATWTYDSGSRTMTVVDDNAGSLSAIDPQDPLRLAASRPMLATVAPIDDAEDAGDDDGDDEPAVLTSLPPWGQRHAEHQDEPEGGIEDEQDDAGPGPGTEDPEAGWPDDTHDADESASPPSWATRIATTRSRLTWRRPTLTLGLSPRPTLTLGLMPPRSRSGPGRPLTPRTSRCSRPRQRRHTGRPASPACPASTTSCSVPAPASSRAPARLIRPEVRRRPRHAAG